MASDTVPAAADGPNPPPGNTPVTAAADQGGGVAGLLAPVQAARSATFNLDPATGTAAPDAAAAGITSETFHNTPENTGNSSTETSTQKHSQSILRALALAAAERWRKGADARLKALDVQKERAKQNQVKTTATVNRSEKILGGSTHTGSSTNTNSGKSLDNKTRQHHSGNNGNGSGGNGSGGRGGNSGGRGHNGGSGSSGSSGSSGGRGGTGAPGSPNRNGAGNDHGPKHRRDNHGRGTGTDSRKNSGNDQSRDNGAHHSKDGSRANTRTNSGSSGARGTQGPSGPAGGRGPSGGTERRPDAPQRIHRPGDNSGRPWRTNPNTPDRPAPKNQQNPDAPKTRDEPNQTSPGPQQQPKPPTPDKVSLEKKPPTTPATPTDQAKQTSQRTPNRQQPEQARQRPTNQPRTQGSRETGYRDGARAANTANHVIAYTHGVRDGWNDQREHGRREAAQLDQAHTDRRQHTPHPQPKPQEIPPMPSQPPTNAAAQPVQVTSVDATHVHLGAGASRASMSRGEIRTLKHFERRFRTRADSMTNVAANARLLEDHAIKQAQQVTKLLEQARTVKGGEKLLGKLAKTAEAAKAQADKAKALHKRAVRGRDATHTLLANVDTRYGDIYKAVVNSDETAPAELAFYRDTES